MICKKCGAALPGEGFICKSCGMMMSSEQIKTQKEFRKENKKGMEVNLLSDRYSDSPIKRNYNTIKENKYLGALLIVLVVIVLIIIAILKVM